MMQDSYSSVSLQKLFEETNRDLRRGAWPQVRRRVKSQGIIPELVGVRKDGALLFRTNSGTTKGKYWNQMVKFKDISVARELFFESKVTYLRLISLLQSGDLLVHCNDPSYKYYWQYLATQKGYAIRKNIIYPKKRNPNLTGSVCFVDNTLVTTDKGLVPIKDIEIGDLVLTHRGEYKEVLNTGNRMAMVYEYTTSNQTFRCTPSHKFFIEHWDSLILKPIQSIPLYTCLVADSQEILLSKTSIGLERVYNITVAEDESYTITDSKIAVSNCKHLVSVLQVLPFLSAKIAQEYKRLGVLERMES